MRLDVGHAPNWPKCCNSSGGWLPREPARLAASPGEFTGHPGHGVQDLPGNPERVVFLPGGSDGEPFFGP